MNNNLNCIYEIEMRLLLIHNRQTTLMRNNGNQKRIREAAAYKSIMHNQIIIKIMSFRTIKQINNMKRMKRMSKKTLYRKIDICMKNIR